MKANYVRINTIVKQNEYGFILVNFIFLVPILDQSFTFPLHVDFFFEVTPRKKDGKWFCGRNHVGDK
jgi:hypothetical protein